MKNGAEPELIVHLAAACTLEKNTDISRIRDCSTAAAAIG